jgi:tetratricopeptide (TPR) repeat protein
MKWAVCALLCAWAYAAGGACRYLELRAPGETRAGETGQIPLYLAYPDTLGPVAVRPFLEASAKDAEAMVKQRVWQLKTLNPYDRRLLKILRDLIDGHGRDAGEEMAILTKQAPARLRSTLRVDKALLAFLAGLPAEAEKDWRGVLKAGSECEEVAWRNLYSLYLTDRDFSKAHGLVDEVLKGNPKNRWANSAKGYLVRMLLPPDDLEDFLRDKSSWQDSLFEIQIAYGKFLKEKGQLEEARKYYNRGLEGAPRNGQAWLELADIQYRLGYYVFAETCLRNAFDAGINDPYVFELYGQVLTSLSTYAANGWEMRALGFGWDAQWAAQCWRVAERILEAGLPHDLNSRSMAHLLYHIYCHNGRVDAALNLRYGFWFLFSPPAIPKSARLEAWSYEPPLRLIIPVSYITYPLIAQASSSDFFEPF